MADPHPRVSIQKLEEMAVDFITVTPTIETSIIDAYKIVSANSMHWEEK